MAIGRTWRTVLCLLPVCVTVSAYGQSDVSVLQRRLAPSLLAVYAHNRDGLVIGQATGFFVNKEGHVITARDVFKGTDHANVKTADGMLYAVRTVLAEDPEANLIRVSTGVPSASSRPPEFNLALPRVGERLFVLPNPWEANRPVAPARVSALLDVPAFGTLIGLITVLSPGYNGSLLVNGRDQVVGAVTLADLQNFHAIPMERVAKLTAGPGRTLEDWEAKRDDAAERSYSEALGYEQRGDYEKALLSLRQAVTENPRYAEAHFQMGYCYSQLRRNDDAVKAYREAVRLKPDFVLAHFYLGLAYLDLKDKEGARREHEALKSLDKDYARDLLGLM